MNWEAIGAIGELIGALAVVLTLVYLAVQVRHSKQLLERNEKIAFSQVHQARADSRLDMHLSIADSDHVVAVRRIWGKPELIDELSEEEHYAAQSYMYANMVHQDNILFQGELGLADEQTVLATRDVLLLNQHVWEKLGVVVTPRIRDYFQSINTS